MLPQKLLVWIGPVLFTFEGTQMVLPILGNRELGASVPTGENKAPAVSAGVFATIPVERPKVKLLKLLVIGFIILL